MANFVDYQNAYDLMSAIAQNMGGGGLKIKPIYASDDVQLSTFALDNNLMKDQKIKAVYIPRMIKYISGNNGFSFGFPNYSGWAPYKVIAKAGSGTYHNKTFGFSVRKGSSDSSPNVPAVVISDSMLIKARYTNGSTIMNHLFFNAPPKAELMVRNETITVALATKGSYGSTTTEEIPLGVSAGDSVIDISRLLINNVSNLATTPGNVCYPLTLITQNESSNAIGSGPIKFGTGDDTNPSRLCLNIEDIFKRIFYAWSEYHIGMYDFNIGDYSLEPTFDPVTGDYGNSGVSIDSSMILSMKVAGWSSYTQENRPIAFIITE